MNDTKKDAGKNDEVLRHWQNEHDKLKLADVEYVTAFFCWNSH